ncbi:MAG TPA: hypothetical protein VF541_13965 [Longimicrobium sp.]|jgi:hypothetical protein
MTAFARGQTIFTSTPVITVDGLPAARYEFQLVVEDNSGNLSAPVTAFVEVFPPVTTTTTRPTIPTIPTIPTTIPRINIPTFKLPLNR